MITGNSDNITVSDECLLREVKYFIQKLKQEGQMPKFVDEFEKYSDKDFLVLYKLWKKLPSSVRQFFPQLDIFMNSLFNF